MAFRQEHFRMLARYNGWANERLYGCAAQLSPGALAENRGAFFGSLLGTLNHLLVTDRLWMSRLEGVSPRGTRLDQVFHEDFGDLSAARHSQDQKIIAFVHDLSISRHPSTTPRPAAHRSRSPSIRCSLICSTIRRTTAVRRIT